jgi:flagellar L-ring protein precursor FlgH
MRFIRLALVAFSLVAGTAGAESLYNEADFRALASDNKAFRVGDVITVQVYENSSASTKTNTATQRKNNLNGSVTLLKPGFTYGASAAVGGDFAGGGSTQRANNLLATLTVTVREVMANGELRVAGEQLLTVNGESQKVNVEGRVRPQDISTDNAVLSTRLADARITYLGNGDLSERQRRAWWRVVLDVLGF